MKKLILLLVLPSILLMSCAKEENETTEAVQDRLLKAYITVVHLDTLQPTALGYYAIKLSEGTGATPSVGDWVKWEQVQRSLDETVASVTEKADAIQYGLYNALMQTVHYVPNYNCLDENYMALCLVDILPKMKEGAKYRLFVPARLMSTKGSSSQNIYGSYILDITLREVIKSPQQYELDQVTDYKNLNYPEINVNDTIKYGMYYKTTYVAPDTVWQLDSEGVLQPILKDTTSAVDGKKAYVTYVGRFLDGFVFDTNIIDSAKVHNIYDATRSYDTLTVTIGNRSTGSVVFGFEKIVMQLKKGDSGIGFFISELGYGAYGSGSTQQTTTSTIIQPYTPLFFEVRVHKITN